MIYIYFICVPWVGAWHPGNDHSDQDRNVLRIHRIKVISQNITVFICSNPSFNEDK